MTLKKMRRNNSFLFSKFEILRCINLKYCVLQTLLITTIFRFFVPQNTCLIFAILPDYYAVWLLALYNLSDNIDEIIEK